MCLAKPYRIKKINQGWAEIENQKKVNLALVPQACVGDWLLVHADLAVNILTKKEAEEILTLTKKHQHCHSRVYPERSRRESGNL